MDEMKREPPDGLDEVSDGGSTTTAEDGVVGEPEGSEWAAAAARARQDLDALNDRHLRLAAEFDNYRKRTERERTETWSRSQAELATALLDVLDDLQRVAHVDPEATSVESLLEGVQLVERKLLRALSAAGLEEVAAADERFDPSTMEALMTVEADTAEQDDTVSSVLQKGYRFKGQLLRPARVQVRKYHG